MLDGVMLMMRGGSVRNRDRCQLVAGTGRRDPRRSGSLYYIEGRTFDDRRMAAT
jgi:hypothetical protein